LLRPEGLALIALLFVFLLLIKRKRFVTEVTIVAALLAPWLVFSWIYFGSPIPHSITAKLALYVGFDTVSFWERLVALLDLDSMFGWLALLAALWGLVYLLIWTYWGFLEALFVALLVGGLALSETHLFFWYKAPLTPFLVLFISAGAIGVYRLALSVSGRATLVRAGAALVLLAAVAAFGGQLRGVRDSQRAQLAEIQRNHLRAGRYLAERATEGAVVVAEDIGYLGYTFRGLVIDRDGLVSPEMAAFNRRLDYTGALEMALARYPRHWLYLAPAGPLTERIVQSGILARRYELVGDFAQPDGGAYLLYRAVAATSETSVD
ncbi:MAG TPA: hypothetical protein VLB27_12010, partial [candidate division Zixibacteria bacterium]|nr:hypothetical protein [candidate division Zixibacteria bacterium]